MASDDFFMRQIEGVTDMLAMLMFDKTASDEIDAVYETRTSAEGHTLLIDLKFLITQGKINEAENLLFENMEVDAETSYIEVSRQFYAWLDVLSDDALQQSNYSREEIAEGRNAIQRFYGK